MSARRSRIVAGAAALLAASAVVPAGSAAAAPAGQLHVVKVLSSRFVGPLQFAVSPRRIVVADAFTSTLSTLHGTVLARGPSSQKGGDLAGVAIAPLFHELAYTTSNGDHSRTYLTVMRAGKQILRVNLAEFERTHNPDGNIVYGVEHPSECVRNALEAAKIPVHYTGAVDSHPYAVAPTGDGGWVVADAGGNDVLTVTASGRVSVLTVLPRRLMVVSQALADREHLPNCVVGVKYWVEAVPTDVESTRRGFCVSTLPGGELPANGRVYFVKRGTHQRSLIGAGFHEATNLAVTAKGRVYVVELGKGRISRLVDGRPQPVLALPGVVAVEWGNRHLYASTAPLVAGGSGPGQIVLLGS